MAKPTPEEVEAAANLPYVRDLVHELKSKFVESRAYGYNDGVRACRNAVQNHRNRVYEMPLPEDTDKKLAKAIRDTHLDLLSEIMSVLPTETSVPHG